MVLAGERRMACRERRGMGLMAGRQDLARAGEIGRSIDTERKRVNERHVDPHSGLERAQLLEALPPLERTLRQRDVALERLAPVGVEPDVMVVRPLAPGHDGAAEIERTRDAPA